ncbi:MAG TPA: mechanosensitive ion channel [Candidatus Altiarchaeales archaeon]|nr:mechanosensitive ion channel [Candidatus Altiarchaeales archaeon]
MNTDLTQFWTDFINSIDFGDLIERIIFSAIIITAAFLLVQILKPSIKRLDDEIDAIDLSKHSRKLITKAMSYIVYIVALVIILSIFGLDEALYTLLTGGAILGFAIGYAAKDIVSNMLSGIIIAVDRPFKIGHDVELVGVKGTVKEISLRTTVIKLEDGTLVEIPNSLVISKPIKNFSRKKK